jgi:PKD repeat protein
VTGLGPTPRPDDVAAVQWLYPNGSTVTPPTSSNAPNAPSGLTATASGSTITLRWSRNSTNESGYYVYLSYNGGTFNKLSGSFAAGATAGNVTNADVGSYRIYITAFNSSGESSQSNTATANVASNTPPAPLSAFFTVSQSSGIAGQTQFQFTDASTPTGSVASRVWNFGDNSTASTPTATHVFAAAGAYAVTLTVFDGLGGSAQYSMTISVSASGTPAGPSVQATFSFSPIAPTTGVPVTFTDKSTGSPTAWTWNFGDGNTSFAQNPTHTYGSAGTYTVTLTVSNATTSSIRSSAVVVGQSTQLTLNDARYKVSISARDQRTGKTAVGIATVHTGEFGYFSLPELTGDANNPEVFVKVLGPVNGVPWVFFGGLTDVEYTLTVTDTQTGQARQYYHAPGDAKGGYDTGTGQLPAGGCVANTIADSRSSLSRANATSSQLALMNNRFALTLSAMDPRTGATATGFTLPKNDESGFYALPGLTGDANNVEVFVKIVNATSADGHYWIFYGGLTDFQYTLTVTDTQTGKQRSYTKPAGSACGGFDTSNF